MSTPPIILVPGFWLGAWAWDEVAAILRSEGHDVEALTLPGLDSIDTDRSGIGLSDHTDAIVEAVRDARRPVVLAVHSGSGAPGYAATDVIPDGIAAMVYVDTGPAKGALVADFEGDEYPLPPPDVLAEDENLDGLGDEQFAEFRRRAIPQPGGVLREAADISNEARRDIPTTVICCAFTSDQYRDAAAAGYAFLAGISDLHDVTWIDLPTSHWPMWSRPSDLAEILARIAAGVG